MATTAKIAKDLKLEEKIKQNKAQGKGAPKFAIRHRNRCKRCGRPRGFMRKFELCRICFRQLSLAGEVPGVTKSSW
jgi:small subunit ribosomal protein S14